MAGKSQNMKTVLELRDRELAAIAELKRKLDTAHERLKVFDETIAAMGGKPLPSVASQTGGTRKTNVKMTVMAIVNDAGLEGVTAAQVVERAARAGKPLVAGSVSSLLSRFKREGALTFDGERYRGATSGTHGTAWGTPLPLKVVS